MGTALPKISVDGRHFDILMKDKVRGIGMLRITESAAVIKVNFKTVSGNDGKAIIDEIPNY